MAQEFIELLANDPDAKSMISAYHKAAMQAHLTHEQYITGRDIVLLATLINNTDAVNALAASVYNRIRLDMN